MEKKQILIIIEIPEFESLILTDKFSTFKITGIETEKPIIRLDNFLFEGKWYYNKDPIFFFKKKEKSLLQSNFKNFLISNNKNKFSEQKLKIFSLNDHKNLNLISHKRLRLFRIPLIFSE
jgi:hypothetical protein